MGPRIILPSRTNAIPTTRESDVLQNIVPQASSKSYIGSEGMLSSTNLSNLSAKASIVLFRLESSKASAIFSYLLVATGPVSSDPSPQSSSPSFSQSAGISFPLSQVKVSPEPPPVSSEPSPQSSSPSFSQSAGISFPLSHRKMSESPDSPDSSAHSSICSDITSMSWSTPLSNDSSMEIPIIIAIPQGIGGDNPHWTSISDPSETIVSLPIIGGQSMPHIAPAKRVISSKNTPSSWMLSESAMLNTSMSMSTSSVGTPEADNSRE